MIPDYESLPHVTKPSLSCFFLATVVLATEVTRDILTAMAASLGEFVTLDTFIDVVLASVSKKE